MSGCAHPASMEFCARIDYIGIGWYVTAANACLANALKFFTHTLISASVGTVVHYGFQCHPELGKLFLVCCFLTGLAGNIFPFMVWFNQYEYRVRISLFFI
jgi:adiponectin receptor